MVVDVRRCGGRRRRCLGMPTVPDERAGGSSAVLQLAGGNRVPSGGKVAVGRGRRDAVADALASFLRGETRRAELGAVLQRSAQPDERDGQPKSDGDAYLDEMLALWTHEARYGPASEEMWEGWCHHLAFLKSDLE